VLAQMGEENLLGQVSVVSPGRARWPSREFAYFIAVTCSTN